MNSPSIHNGLGLIFMLTWATLISDGFAHPGHSHKILKEVEIIEAAKIFRDSLVFHEKIAGDWEKVSEVAAEKIMYDTGPEWRVVFSRPRAKNPKRRSLYIFLSEYGEYIAANYTGN